MRAARIDFPDVQQGAEFTLPFTLAELNPDGTAGAAINISTWGFHMQLRRRPDSPDPPLLDVTVGSGITIVDGPAGAGLVLIDATVMDDVPPTGGSAWRYDLFAIPDGDVAKKYALFFGEWTVNAKVTA